ncbi:hypothetical protein PV327_006757 [Microctonus hyperodae]|uniref:Cytochrome c oxidase assembly factor 6 homolog n=1 Tax=Microctonus hyperodae TaxID=165561 RepID=A0AA39KIW8_MICHY|nr:hypothetical protein PV327_006757 [Microctonus hyperodae]
MSFPNKEDRQACWGCRDEYWQCLDQGKSENECESLRKQYEKFCPSQWVKHFDRKREYLKFKEQIEQEGYLITNRLKTEAAPLDYSSTTQVMVRRLPHRRVFFSRNQSLD